MPTEAVVADGVRAAYWVDTGTKAHVRWVRPEPERLVAALARLQAGGGLSWARAAATSVRSGRTGSSCRSGTSIASGTPWSGRRRRRVRKRLDEALADDAPLTDAEAPRPAVRWRASGSRSR